LAAHGGSAMAVAEPGALACLPTWARHACLGTRARGSMQVYAVSALLSRAHTSSSAQAGQTRCATGRSVVGLDVTAAAPTAPSSFVFV